MNVPLRFALSHMVAPCLEIAGLCALPDRLGVRQIEIHNDLDDVAIGDGTPAEEVRRQAEAAGFAIRSIDALQCFDHWAEARAVEAGRLIDTAKACGADAPVLRPLNDAAFAPPKVERLRRSMGAMRRGLARAARPGNYG